MRLYHQPRSRSTRVLWLAEEADAPLDVVVIAREEKSTDDYRKMHPLGRSPAYVEDGGPCSSRPPSACTSPTAIPKRA